MASLDDDDVNSQASSDNDNDDAMEDVDEGGDMDGEGDNDDDNDNDNENDDDEEDQDDNADALDDTPSRRPSARAPRRSASRSPTQKTLRSRDDDDEDEEEADNRKRHKTTNRDNPRTPDGKSSTARSDRLSIRHEALTASTYDIVPTIASPHSTSINALCATPDMRWVFTGGADGWIRKFHWPDTANGKTLLTVAQRHPFVDSVTKAGVLLSYWENEEPNESKNEPGQPADESLPLSPVYSLAVQKHALWLLSGTETGAINIQAIRHGEGKRITSLFGHSSAVSVLALSHDEKSALSGSWDKSILDWDLNAGRVKRTFSGGFGQVSAIENRPISGLAIPNDTLQAPLLNQAALAPPSTTFSTNESKPRTLQSNSMRKDSVIGGGDDAMGSPTDSLFGGNVDQDSLFGDTDGDGNGNMGFGGDDDDDEFSKAIANDIQQQPGQPEGNGKLDAAGTENASKPGGDEAVLEAEKPQAESPKKDNTSQHGDPGDFEMPEAPATSRTQEAESEPVTSETIFLDAAQDGTIKIWDRRQQNPVAKIPSSKQAPPWCMSACWSPDGNSIFAGRRNCTVDEYNLHKGLREPVRSLRLPGGSGPVSSVRTMPNGRHLLCASHDILRLYDLKDEESVRHSKVPFLIVPGHRTGMISHCFLDPTCSFLITVGGNRGWEGAPSETLLGYEIGYIK